MLPMVEWLEEQLKASRLEVILRIVDSSSLHEVCGFAGRAHGAKIRIF